MSTVATLFWFWFQDLLLSLLKYQKDQPLLRGCFISAMTLGTPREM